MEEVKPEVVERIFAEQVMPRMELGGFPIDQALTAAQYEQTQGAEGLMFTMNREDTSTGAQLERLDMRIRGDEIVFSLGQHTGPFEITVGAVQGILEERNKNRS